MTGFLLDTNVVSMFSPTQVMQDAGFADWLEEQEKHEAVYLSGVTIHEIEKGAGLLRARGATSKAALIHLFLQRLMAGYGDRVLALDTETALESGRMEAKAIAAGHNPGFADAVIAGDRQPPRPDRHHPQSQAFPAIRHIGKIARRTDAVKTA